MKKMLSVFLCATLLCSVFSFVCAAEGEPADPYGSKKIISMFLKYDANGDKKLTTADAQLILRAACGIVKPDLSTMDLNGDGAVTTADARLALRLVLGIDSPVPAADALNFFNAVSNSVKVTKPGFTGTVSELCSSMRITTNGLKTGLIDLDVKDMEFKDYCEKYKSLFKLAMSADEYNELMEAKDEVYKQHDTAVSADPGRTSHYTSYPVDGFTWASELTADDIAGISVTFDGTYIYVKITMGDYDYTGAAYPTTLAKQIELPYGKVFTLPYVVSSDYTLDSMSLKNGTVEYKVAASSGAPVGSSYNYGYVFQYSKQMSDSSDGLNCTMTTKQTVGHTESYTINEPTAAA